MGHDLSQGMVNSLQVNPLGASTASYYQTRTAFSPGSSLLLRQTVCRARSSTLTTAPSLGATPNSEDLAAARHNLLKIVAELRSPQGGWPSELPQTPETLKPYVSEEAYELLDALRQSPLPQLMPAVDQALLSLSSHATIDGLISPLLWSLFRSAYEIMRLIEGIDVEIIPPTHTASDLVEAGVLRLAAVLVLKTAAGDGLRGPIFEHHALDLVTQVSPEVDHWLDPQSSIQSLNAEIWPQTTDGKTLLSRVENQIQQQMPLLTPWLEGLAVDCLPPHSPWQQGVLQLQFGLAFWPLSANQPAVVTPEGMPDSVSEVISTVIPVTPVDVKPPSPDIAAAKTKPSPVNLTILDLFGDGESLDPEIKQLPPQPLDSLDTDALETGSPAPLAYPEPKVGEDLFANFADEQSDTPPISESSSINRPRLPATADEDLFSNFWDAPLGSNRNTPVENPSEPDQEQSLVDPRCFELFGGPEPSQISAIDPSTMTANEVALEKSPGVTLPSCLQSWISFTDEAWLQQFLDALADQQLIERLNQSNHQFSDMTASDYDALLDELISAAYLTVDRLQSNTGFFQQGFWHQSILLSDWISRLWWYVIRSSSQLMLGLGGMPAEWLQPGQAWQSGTCQWVLGLQLEVEEQLQYLDITTGMPMDWTVPALDTVLVLNNIALAPDAKVSSSAFLAAPKVFPDSNCATLATRQQQLQTLLSQASPALAKLFEETKVSLHQFTSEAEETVQAGSIKLYLVPRLTSG